MINTHLFSNFPDYNSPGFSMENFESLFDEGTVIFNARSKEISYDEHSGSFTLKCAFNGMEHYTTRKCRYRVDDDSFLVIKECFPYSSYIDSLDYVESFSIFFNKKLVNDTIGSLINSGTNLLDDPESKCVYAFPSDAELHRYDENMLRALINLRAGLSKGLYSKEAIREKLQDVLEILLLKNEQTNKEISGIPAVNRSTKEEYYKRLKTIIDYLHSNYDTAITIDTLSKIACLNPSHLIRIFKKVYNLTPYSYLTNVRLEKSKQLLAKTDINISQISTLVGFEKLSSFSYLFSSRYKISPTNFRLCGDQKSQYQRNISV